MSFPLSLSPLSISPLSLSLLSSLYLSSLPLPLAHFSLYKIRCLTETLWEPPALSSYPLGADTYHAAVSFHVNKGESKVRFSTSSPTSPSTKFRAIWERKTVGDERVTRRRKRRQNPVKIKRHINDEIGIPDDARPVLNLQRNKFNVMKKRFFLFSAFVRVLRPRMLLYCVS